METFTTLLQWLIPSGGLGAIVVWLLSKTLRKIRTTKEIHDTYKQLYENIKETLVDLQDENKKLYKAVSKLERTISHASTCRYYTDCPIRHELLREQEGSTKPVRHKRQYASQGGQESGIRASPGIEGTPDNSG